MTYNTQKQSHLFHIAPLYSYHMQMLKWQMKKSLHIHAFAYTIEYKTCVTLSQKENKKTKKENLVQEFSTFPKTQKIMYSEAQV